MSKKVFTTAVLIVLTTLAPSQPTVHAAEEEIAITFSYTDANAENVGVAGEFSNWNILPMAKGENGKWTKTLYLKPGNYGYKFVINGDWKLDPNNPARKTVNDIENSAITVGSPPPAASPALAGNPSATFSYTNPSAKTVHVAGEFNKWLDNVEGKVTGKSEWQMQKDADGKWKLTTQLAPGRYKFKYVIDGGEKWEQDPALPASSDGNSLIEVKALGLPAPTPAPAAGGAQVTFTYADPTAKAVFLAGQFNNWSPTATPLHKDDSGLWTASVPLKPGRYQYKFVVDSDWRLDPSNPDSTDDGAGNMNSIKTVAP